MATLTARDCRVGITSYTQIQMVGLGLTSSTKTADLSSSPSRPNTSYKRRAEERDDLGTNAKQSFHTSANLAIQLSATVKIPFYRDYLGLTLLKQSE